MRVRRSILEAVAVANHNDAARRQVDEYRAKMNDELIEYATQLDRLGLLAEGVTPVIFIRFWFSLLFGQVICELDDSLAVTRQEWVDTLLKAGATLVRAESTLSDDSQP
jgi:hypothetical protein